MMALMVCMCLFLVMLWEVAAHFSERRSERYRTAEARLCEPPSRIAGWRVKRIYQKAGPGEGANILALGLLDDMGQGQEGAVIVRFAHGYNVPECLKLKGYQVVELGALDHKDTRDMSVGSWLVTEPSSEMSVWCAVVVKSSDLGATDLDVGSLAFPRMSRGDDPSWQPGGISLESLKRPFFNARRYVRRKWSNARCDLLTFLKLRRPAEPNAHLLTLVAHGRTTSSGVDETRAHVEEALVDVWSAFRNGAGEP